MVDDRKILEILDDQLSADPVYIWLRVSQKYDLSIVLVPREDLFHALKRLREGGYIREIPVGESDIQFLLTVKGVRRKLLTSVSKANEFALYKNQSRGAA